MRLLAFALALVASGCYQIDADISGLSASAGVQTFAGAGAAAGQPLTIDRMLTFAGGSALAATISKAQLDVVTLTPTAGVGSLDFLSSLQLVLHTDGADVPLVDASGDMAAADGTVALPINRDVDPALLDKPMQIEARLELAPPAQAWSMRVDAALTVAGHADLHP